MPAVDDGLFRVDDANANVGVSTGQWQLELATGQLSHIRGESLWLDGALVASNPDTTPLVNSDHGAVGRGFLTDSGPSNLQGGIGEVLVFTEALSDPDRQAVESYLKAKWGIP